MRSLNVLSVCDGMACGLKAFDSAGIPVDKYFSSEVDETAIAVSRYNHYDGRYIAVGDVCGVDSTKLSAEIDILIGGTPCTDISVAGKQKGIQAHTLEEYLILKRKGTGFKGQSYLFWEYVRLLREIQPKFFFLENVRMRKDFLGAFNNAIGIEPTKINSNLLTAQNRVRFYWFGVRNEDGTYSAIPVRQPEDSGTVLKDIVHEKVDTDVDISDYIVPFNKTLKILGKEVQRGKIGFFNNKDSQANRVYSIHGKAVTLCGSAGGGAAKMGQYLFGCITPDRVNKRQNGQRFNTGGKFYTLTTQDRHGVLIDGYIRKITPVECERLQGLPDGTTKYGLFPDNYGGLSVREVSDAQRYKLLGNGWTLPIIAHQFRYLKDFLMD